MSTTPFPFFTLQIHLKEPIEGSERKNFQFKNLTAEEVKQYREDMFLIGIRIEHTARSWEIISPFNIKRVLVLGQNSKE
jgi:hypothetical protein